MPRNAAARLIPVLATALVAAPAHAFCGFFVGKADAQLFNRSSQVAIARDGDRTVITLSNDYKGELTDFALVVPVPAVLERDQIHVGDRALLQHLDAYSAPRLVEYQDPDPCQRVAYRELMMRGAAPAAASRDAVRAPAAALGVQVEARYTVGEYDIVLLSAQQSSGLETWLTQEGYRIPRRAAAALAPYVRQRMKFFVARVNLKEQLKSGFSELRPLQIAFESPRFMLPIRLGMANAEGPQDLIVYALTPNGRVESTNYQTARVPTGQDVPEYVQGEFGRFYQAAFERAHARHDRRVVLTEYAWNMASCDPCSAQPLSPDELRALGAMWLDPARPGAASATLTRLHVRYDADHFPEDLMFQETGDRQPFQARYVLRHAWTGEASCVEGQRYREALRERRRGEARTLAELTGWDPEEIRSRMGSDLSEGAPDGGWWRRIWKDRSPGLR